jgi:hypothetical protein
MWGKKRGGDIAVGENDFGGKNLPPVAHTYGIVPCKENETHRVVTGLLWLL